MVESSAKSLTYLIFIRHGERSDACYDNSNNFYINEIRHDPTLTSAGHIQAKTARNYV